MIIFSEFKAVILLAQRAEIKSTQYCYTVNNEPPVYKLMTIVVKY